MNDKKEYQCQPCFELHNRTGIGKDGKFISGAKRIRCPKCYSGKVKHSRRKHNECSM